MVVFLMILLLLLLFVGYLVGLAAFVSATSEITGLLERMNSYMERRDKDE